MPRTETDHPEPEARGVQPLSAADLARMRRTPQAKVIRRALGLTQDEFAHRYRVPLATLQDWEGGRTEPDATSQAYLRVIAAEPATVARALEREAEHR